MAKEARSDRTDSKRRESYIIKRRVMTVSEDGDVVKLGLASEESSRGGVQMENGTFKVVLQMFVYVIVGKKKVTVCQIKGKNECE
jgi:hypothetical protein